jgi:TonB family protein
MELQRLIGQFGEKLRLAGISSVVVVGGQWTASGQNPLQNWLVARVKDALGSEPNRFDIVPDTEGAPIKGFVGPVLDTVGVDAVVSTTVYPAEDGIHFTLDAARANVSSGQETLLADISNALPPTAESAALVPPEWKTQMDEERTAPKPPMADASILSKMPTCLVCPDPKYPELARQLKVKGGVILLATVETDGTIHDAQVLKAFGFGLDEAAIKNMSRWQLSPALDKQGNPVAVRITVQIELRLF